MFFFLQTEREATSPWQITELPEGASPPAEARNTLFLQTGCQHLETHETPGGQLILLGDPIRQPASDVFQRLTTPQGRLDEDLLYQEIKGHYYWFLLQPGRLRCGASFGAIYPVYYHQEGPRTHISSSSLFLAERTGAPAGDKRNLLERLLFNYPFFHSTWWRNIHLLPAHRFLDLSPAGTSIGGEFDILCYFGSVESSSRNELSRLAALFEEETQLFFPDAPFAVSLTGGFDGRTLVAAARQAGHQFPVYCYGRTGSEDLSYSTWLASELGIPHVAARLDEAYLQEEALPSAFAFMQRSEYNGNFGRPHYEYTARLLAEKASYLITGNFGSELFRAMHTPGVMLSDCLVKVFSSETEDWRAYLRQQTEAWAGNFFSEELEALNTDIAAYLEKIRDLDANRKFYSFVYEEMFRKYFGPELVMQSHYLNNRTPYLNLRLIRELNRTKWAGVHSRLFERNLYKRRKGQVFYAAFLQRADRQLYRLHTNKGYGPADVLEYPRLPFLLKGVATHKFFKKTERDEHSVEAFFQQYHTRLREELLGEPAADFLVQLLTSSPEEIDAGRNLSRWIKLYSIAYGWQSAQRSSLSISRSSP